MADEPIWREVLFLKPILCIWVVLCSVISFDKGECPTAVMHFQGYKQHPVAHVP